MEQVHAWSGKGRLGWQAPVALASFGAFAAGFGALHLLRPDLDPMAHFGSEYALGPHGWIMELIFLLFGVGLVSLGLGLLGMLPERIRLTQAGAGFFFLAGASFLVSAVFPTDPLGAPPTTAGTIHNTFGLIVFLSIPLGALLLTAAVWSEERWRPSRVPLAALAVASLAAFLVFPPLAASGLAGLAQRIALCAYISWLIICVAQLHRIAAPEQAARAGAAATDVA